MAKDVVEWALSEAIAAFNRGQFDIAVAECKEILQSNPDNPAAHQLLAVIYLQREDALTARQHITQSLTVRPDHLPSLLTAGRIARKEGELSAAIHYFMRAANLDSAEPEPLFLTGVCLLERGDLPKAVSLLSQLVAQHPQHGPAWGGLGSAFQQAGLLDAACIAFGKAVLLDSTQLDIWFNLGVARQDNGDIAGAAAAFRMALQQRRVYPEAEVNLGIVLQENNEMDEAVNAYRRAYQLQPETFGRIANALTSGRKGKLWLDMNELRMLLAS